MAYGAEYSVYPGTCLHNGHAVGLGAPEWQSVPRSRAVMIANDTRTYAVMLIILLVVLFLLVASMGGITGFAEKVQYRLEVNDSLSYVEAHKGEVPQAVRRQAACKLQLRGLPLINDGTIDSSSAPCDIGRTSGMFEKYSSAIARTIWAKFGLEIVENESTAKDAWRLTTYANTLLSQYPEYLKQKFVASGWRMVITDDDLTKKYLEDDEQLYDIGSGNVMGLTCSREKIIYIGSTRYEVQEAVGHEMGHFVDHLLGEAANEPEFAKAWEEDKQMYMFYFPYDHLNVIDEAYAESMSAYWECGDMLKTLCPHLHQYFADRF